MSFGIKFIIVLSTVIVFVGGLLYFSSNKKLINVVTDLTDNPNLNLEEGGGLEDREHPLSIEVLRKGDYPGSDIVIEQTLTSGSNYKRFVTSYKSEGLKIFGLLTVPNTDPPESGYPVVIFNHGYIAPNVYKTTEKYVAYQDAFARAGYITFKSDYRGHGNSEGIATGGYGSNAYTIDILNAVSSLKKYPNVNPQKIGMWGHSMGGHITLRNMVVSKDIKAGVIWAGVVGSYPDLLNNWRRRNTSPPPGIPTGARRWRQELTEKFGTPEENPQFWNSISANFYLSDISGPIQLHHGTNDASVPIEFSQKLQGQLKSSNKEVELFIYDGDDHNLSKNLSLALKRSVEFFDKNLKN